MKEESKKLRRNNVEAEYDKILNRKGKKKRKGKKNKYDFEKKIQEGQNLEENQ